MIQYGQIYGNKDNENSIWVQTLEEQERKLLNGQFQEEINKANQHEQEGNYLKANQIYQQIKKETNSKRIHAGINPKISRNLAVLRKHLQQRQNEYQRAQTSYLDNRQKVHILQYDSPRRKRDGRYCVNRELQYQDQCGFEVNQEDIIPIHEINKQEIQKY